MCLARLARCSTPVPQSLSVVNKVKAWILDRFVASEGVADVIGLIQKGFASSFLRVVTFVCIVTLHLDCDFGGKKLCRLESSLINANCVEGLFLLAHL